MVELKTKRTAVEIEDFISRIPVEKRPDSRVIAKLMSEATKDKGKMWGSSIAGYGFEHLKYESGRELDWFIMGFSPRKQNMTLYVLRGGAEKYLDLLERLGKHTLGKGCLYIKKLSDIDIDVLKEIVQRAAKSKF